MSSYAKGNIHEHVMRDIKLTSPPDRSFFFEELTDGWKILPLRRSSGSQFFPMYDGALAQRCHHLFMCSFLVLINCLRKIPGRMLTSLSPGLAKWSAHSLPSMPTCTTQYGCGDLWTAQANHKPGCIFVRRFLVGV